MMQITQINFAINGVSEFEDVNGSEKNCGNDNMLWTQQYKGYTNIGSNTEWKLRTLLFLIL